VQQGHSRRTKKKNSCKPGCVHRLRRGQVKVLGVLGLIVTKEKKSGVLKRKGEPEHKKGRKGGMVVEISKHVDTIKMRVKKSNQMETGVRGKRLNGPGGTILGPRELQKKCRRNENF